jgi:hypothetical protein
MDYNTYTMALISNGDSYLLNLGTKDCVPRKNRLLILYRVSRRDCIITCFSNCNPPCCLTHSPFVIRDKKKTFQ